jgi:ribosomal protein S13
MFQISGIGFKTADKVARNTGIAPNSQVRALAGIIHVFSEVSVAILFLNVIYSLLMNTCFM